MREKVRQSEGTLGQFYSVKPICFGFSSPEIVLTFPSVAILLKKYHGITKILTFFTAHFSIKVVNRLLLLTYSSTKDD